MNRKVILSLLGVAAVVALLFYMSISSNAYECKVTVQYGGATLHRVGGGLSEKEAIRAAVESACGTLGLAMDEQIRCQNTPPVEAQCKGPSSGY